MGLTVLLIVLAVVPLAAIVGIYIYLTHGARSSDDRWLKRDRRARLLHRRRPGDERRGEGNGYGLSRGLLDDEYH